MLSRFYLVVYELILYILLGFSVVENILNNYMLLAVLESSALNWLISWQLFDFIVLSRVALILRKTHDRFLVQNLNDRLRNDIIICDSEVSLQNSPIESDHLDKSYLVGNLEPQRFNIIRGLGFDYKWIPALPLHYEYHLIINSFNFETFAA